MVKGNTSAVIQIIDLMQMPIKPYNYEFNKRVNRFNNCIEFRNVSFAYNSKAKNIINNVNFKIFKGEKVAFIGKTGSGKSTAIDILIGLLEPTSGSVLVDNQPMSINLEQWRSSIAHVPQSIYLADCSILENIALGVERQSIDLKRLSEVFGQRKQSLRQ